MRKIFITLLLMTYSISGWSCPDLSDVDLSSEDSAHVYKELSVEKLVLSKSDFLKIFKSFTDASYAEEFYDNCKDHIEVRALQATSTKRIFKAIVTNEDICDGGNAFGALYSEDLKTELGRIDDGYITCN